MSDTVKANVYARCPLGGLPRFLLVTLADECDDAGVIQLDHERVRTKLGIDQRTLSRMIARCEAEAGLVYVPGNGRGNLSTYILAAYSDVKVDKVDKVGGKAPLSSPPKTAKVDKGVTLPTLSTFAEPAALPPTRVVLSPPSEPFTNVQGSVPGSDANASSPGRSAAPARRASATAKPRPKAPPKVDPAYHDRFAMIRDAAELHPRTLTQGDAKAVADAAKALAPMTADELAPMLVRAVRIIRERFAFKGAAAAAPTPAQLRGEVGRMLLAKGIQRPGEGVTIDLRIYHPDGKRRDFVDACGRWPCDRYGEPNEWPPEIRAAFPDRAAQWQADADAQRARVAAMREADHALV